MSPLVSALLPASLIVHALAIVATSRRARRSRRLTFGGSAIASVLMTAAASFVPASGQPLAGVLFVHAASGLVVDYVVTPLSAWFLIVLGAVGSPVALYSIGYLAHAVRPSRTAAVGVAFNVLIAAVSVVEIEPTFERHLYHPLARGVIRLAKRMKVLQAGSLHAYLGYVLLPGGVLLIGLGGQ